MPAVSIRLPEEVSSRLQALAQRTGRSKTFYMLEAIRTHLDEMEDLYMAEQRLLDVRAGRSKIHTLEEVENTLDFAPPSSFRYRLEDLLAHCDGSVAMTDEEREWFHAGASGRELL